MKLKLMSVLAAAALGLAACQQKEETAQAPAAEAPAATAPAAEVAVAADAAEAPGKKCGGFAGETGDAKCGAGEYCDYPDNAVCGTGDVQGVCRSATAEICTEQQAPVCGCNDQPYGNACKARRDGKTDVKNAGQCAGPAKK
jgi:hypothetical protein